MRFMVIVKATKESEAGLRALRLPDDELEHEHVLLGEVRRHRSPDAGVRGSHGVQVLVLAVDRQQAGVLGGDPDDVEPLTRS